MAPVDGRRMIDELRADGLDVTEWSDDPHTSYPEHKHPGREVRVVLEGTMTIVAGGRSHELGPGDRIDLAPNTPHSAVIGPLGVVYLAGTDR